MQEVAPAGPKAEGGVPSVGIRHSTSPKIEDETGALEENWRGPGGPGFSESYRLPKHHQKFRAILNKQCKAYPMDGTRTEATTQILMDWLERGVCKMSEWRKKRGVLHIPHFLVPKKGPAQWKA